MTPIATALASVSLLFAAAPAMAQMHAGGGGHAGGGIRGAAAPAMAQMHAGGGGHVGGGHAGGIHVGGGAGRSGAHDGRAGHFGLRGNGFHGHRHAYGGYGFWPYGGYALGYDYPWYAEADDYGDDEPSASAPAPAPPAG
jgi:hypothetical protein